MIILLIPVFSLVAILIKLDSNGPVIFRQKRVGKGESIFDFYKFRTMADKKEAQSELTYYGDKRITKIGKKLRSYALDELPQLLNVFRGDMSLVGPRPEIPSIVKFYTSEQRKILSVKPGMTGLAQIEYGDKDINHSGIKDIKKAYLEKVLPKKINIDLEYIKNMSFLYDLRIIVRTFVKLFIYRF